MTTSLPTPTRKPARFFPGRRFVIGVPFLWLTFAFLLPFLIVLRMSLAGPDSAANLFANLFSTGDAAGSGLTLSNYVSLAGDDLYVKTYLSSLKFAAITTLLCL